MNLPSKRSISLAVATLVGAVALACAGSDAPVAPTEPAQASTQASPQTSEGPQPRSPTQDPSPESTPAPERVAASSEYDSNRVMYEIFQEVTLALTLTSARLRSALEQISERRDQSLVPVLIEIIRFVPSASSRERMWSVLRDVTGESDLSNDWSAWMEWLGRNLDSHQPPSQYAAWKADMMATLDPRFGEFLRPAIDFSRIDLTEIVWGGVLPDGIPDLRDPKMLTAAEADYLNDGDRVFGVTINGDSRAYPLRIVNAHEMVNDTVGGEPISLLW